MSTMKSYGHCALRLVTQPTVHPMQMVTYDTPMTVSSRVDAGLRLVWLSSSGSAGGGSVPSADAGLPGLAGPFGLPFYP